MRTPHRHNWNTVHRTPYASYATPHCRRRRRRRIEVYLFTKTNASPMHSSRRPLRINAAFRGRGQCARRNTVDFESAQKIFKFAN